MRTLLLLAIMASALIVWYVGDRRRENERQRVDTRLRFERQMRLDQAASAVQRQAEFGRTVADRIRTSPVEIPAALRASVDAVVIELDGVAADLRFTCVPVVHHRRALIHR